MNEIKQKNRENDGIMKYKKVKNDNKNQSLRSKIAYRIKNNSTSSQVNKNMDQNSTQLESTQKEFFLKDKIVRKKEIGKIPIKMRIKYLSMSNLSYSILDKKSKK